MRGRLSTSDDFRSPDSSSTCGRNGASEPCGPFFILSDDLPKPVALLDASGKHARKLVWDAYGALNRRVIRSETPHPYAHNQTYSIFSQTIPSTAGMQMAYRFQFDAFDSEASGGVPLDKLRFLVNYVTKFELGGHHLGRVFTPWQAGGGNTTLHFVSNAKNCPPSGCLTDGGLPDGGNWPYFGASLAALEVAEAQTGALPFDIPLRFPGQYFDAETQKHENHNRFYDTATGRYLSPEPWLQDPTEVLISAYGGESMPTYAYALSNPLRYADLDGLKPGDRFSGKWSQNRAAVDALDWTNRNKNTKWEHGGMVCFEPATREYFATDPVTDKDPASCTPSNSACPKGTVPVGNYHNHPVDPPGLNDEEFSTKDRINNTLDRINGYLRTPSGSFKKYYPNAGFGPGRTVTLWP